MNRHTYTIVLTERRVVTYRLDAPDPDSAATEAQDRLAEWSLTKPDGVVDVRVVSLDLDTVEVYE